MRQAREAVEALAAIWGALSATTDPDRRATLIERYGAALVLHTNIYATLTDRLGLRGPLRAIGPFPRHPGAGDPSQMILPPLPMLCSYEVFGRRRSSSS